jgi:hypothetical protein
MWTTIATWTDKCANGEDAAPHLTPKMREEYYEKIRTTEPHLLDVRTKGMPSFGAGLVYPCDIERVLIDPFTINPDWLLAFSLDTGWNWNGVVFGAYDKLNDIIYITNVYKRGQAEPPIVAAAIQSSSAGWRMPGVADAADVNRMDGRQYIEIYKALGLDIELPNKALETGITQVWNRLSTGRLRIFRTCTALTDELRTYMRDKNGHIKDDQDDHLLDACVVGSTKVMTDNGPVPISELVGSTGKVLSRYGSWANYIGARLTIKNSPTVLLHFVDGSTVRCTPDHPFLTPSGWARADKMTGLSCYNGITQRVQWRNAWKLSWLRSFRKRFRNSMANGIGSVASILNGLYEKSQCRGFIEWFGNIIMAPFRQVMTSTMPMRIEATINYPIWNANSKPSTSAIISRGQAGKFRTMHERPQKFGTDRNLVLTGTSSTMKQTKKNFMCWPITFVNSAASRFNLQRKERIVSVPITVNIGRVWRLALTMKNVLVWFAAKASWSIVMQRKNAVRENALLSCLSVQETENEDVYCLTVPGTSAFCLDNGAVVHNTRYLIMSGIQRAKVRPKTNDVQFDWDSRSASRSNAWMAG